MLGLKQALLSLVCGSLPVTHSEDAIFSAPAEEIERLQKDPLPELAWLGDPEAVGQFLMVSLQV